MGRKARIEIVPVATLDENGHLLPPMTDHEHFLRLRASNGLILGISEAYSTRRKARRAVKAWRTAMVDIVHGDPEEVVREVSE